LKTETETREVVCILCPMGCEITVKVRDGEILEVEDAGCKRGREYSIKELKSPVRDFFTTVRVEGGRTPMLSVRSTEPVPKDMLMACAVELAKLVVPAPVNIGDIIVKDILHLGVDVIATKGVERA